MSAELNYVNGKAAMFYMKAGGTPWHREGTGLDLAPTHDEAMILAGADYEVGMKPISYDAGGDGSAFLDIPNSRAIVNLSSGKAYGVVTKEYKPIQNAPIFRIFEPLVDEGKAWRDTGGTLRDGQQAWMLVGFNIPDPLVQEVFGSEVVPFGLAVNDHSGHGTAYMMKTDIRVVCANTLGEAMSRSTRLAVPHRTGGELKLIEAAETLFADQVAKYRLVAEGYRRLKDYTMSNDDFVSSVLDTVAPFPKALHSLEGEHITTRGYDMAYNKAEERRNAITNAWHNGDGHKGDSSAWEAVNGAVQVIDHDSNLFKTKGSRVASLLGGRLEQRKTALFNAVMELV